MLILNIIFTALAVYGSFVVLRTVLIHIKLIILKIIVHKNKSLKENADVE